MNLAVVTEQIRAIQDRMARTVAEHPADPGSRLEASEALGVAVEELRVVGEELRRQNAELRATQWALEEERRRYQDLFENAPDAYLVTDAQGVVREANGKAAELLNVPGRFLAGKLLPLFVAEEARQAFRSELARLGACGGVGRYELRICPRREQAFDAEVSAQAVPGEGGRSVMVRWALRDVTLRRRIEDRLRLMNQDLERFVRERTAQLGEEYRERERFLMRAHAASELAGPQFRELIQGLDAIFWTADPESGRYTFVSQGAVAILGYPVAAWLEDPRFWAEHLHADDRDWMIEHRARRLREGGDSESEYRLVAADGRYVWFREALHVACDEAGRPRALRGLLVNINRRKKVERQLYAHRSELSERLADLAHLNEMSGRLSSTLELQPILEEILTGAMSVQGALKGVLRLYHRDRRELTVAVATGLPASFLKFTARVPIGVGIAGRAIALRHPVLLADTAGAGVDAHDREAARLGEYRAAFSFPLRDRSGEMLGTITTFFDEPHNPPVRQVRLVELLAGQAADFVANASQYREAREAGRGREVMLAVFAQELRDQLDAIRAALPHLGPPPRRGARRRAEARAIIEHQVGRLDRLIGDLLDASRFGEKRALHREPIDLREALLGAAESLRAEMDGRGHDLRLSLPEAPLWVEADASRIEQAFVNLLTAAARSRPPGAGGRTEVSAARQGEEIVVRVRDNGRGLAPGEFPRVFGVLAEDDDLPPPTLSSTEREDLGVALWLARRLVELHDGRVTVSSAVAGAAQGIEFLVILPALPKPPTHAGVPARLGPVPVDSK